MAMMSKLFAASAVAVLSASSAGALWVEGDVVFVSGTAMLELDDVKPASELRPEMWITTEEYRAQRKAADSKARAAEVAEKEEEIDIFSGPIVEKAKRQLWELEKTLGEQLTFKSNNSPFSMVKFTAQNPVGEQLAATKGKENEAWTTARHPLKLRHVTIIPFSEWGDEITADAKLQLKELLMPGNVRARVEIDESKGVFWTRGQASQSVNGILGVFYANTMLSDASEAALKLGRQELLGLNALPTPTANYGLEGRDGDHVRLSEHRFHRSVGAMTPNWLLAQMADIEDPQAACAAGSSPAGFLMATDAAPAEGAAATPCASEVVTVEQQVRRLNAMAIELDRWQSRIGIDGPAADAGNTLTLRSV